MPTIILPSTANRPFAAPVRVRNETGHKLPSVYPEGPSFHFVLNNKIFFDNRIPPRGFTNAAFQEIQSPPVGYSYADGQYWDDTQYILPTAADSDGDGHGDAQVTRRACITPEGYVSLDDDCNDADPDVYPGAPPKADGLDNDCDGIVDREAQSINFTVLPDQQAAIELITLNATSSSGLAVTFVLEEGNAELQGNVLYISGSGTETVTAFQAGSEGYLPAEPVSRSFCINPPKPAILSSFENGQPILISSSELGNQWFLDGQPIPGAIYDTLGIEETGTYTVQVESDQCVSETSDELFMEATSAAQNKTITSSTYPNPTDGKIYINISKQFEGISLNFSIFDHSGRYIISSVPLPELAANVCIDISYLEPGVYIYLLANENAEYFLRGQIIRK